MAALEGERGVQNRPTLLQDGGNPRCQAVTPNENQRRAFHREWLDDFTDHEWSQRPGRTVADDTERDNLKLLRLAYGR